jgi:hypothetical protein
VNSDERALNFVKQTHNMILGSTSNSNSSYYLIYVKNNEENKEARSKIAEFCEGFKLSLMELNETFEFSQRNLHLLYIFNNILMKKNLVKSKPGKDLSGKRQTETYEKEEVEMKLGCNEEYYMEEFSEINNNIHKRTYSDNKIILSKKN